MKIGCGKIIEREGFVGDNDCGEMCKFCKEVHYCFDCLRELAYQEAKLCYKAQGFKFKKELK